MKTHLTKWPTCTHRCRDQDRAIRTTVCVIDLFILPHTDPTGSWQQLVSAVFKEHDLIPSPADTLPQSHAMPCRHRGAPLFSDNKCASIASIAKPTPPIAFRHRSKPPMNSPLPSSPPNCGEQSRREVFRQSWHLFTTIRTNRTLQPNQFNSNQKRNTGRAFCAPNFLRYRDPRAPAPVVPPSHSFTAHYQIFAVPSLHAD